MEHLKEGHQPDSCSTLGRHLMSIPFQLFGFAVFICRPVGKEEPSFQGIAEPPRRISLENEISRWDFTAGSSRSVVEVAGQRWEFECQAPLAMRAWLEPAPFTEPRPNRSAYRLTEDGIDL